MGYDTLIRASNCLLHYRIKYSQIWGVYMTYQDAVELYKLPFLISFVVSTMREDKAVLTEYEIKNRRENEQ